MYVAIAISEQRWNESLIQSTEVKGLKNRFGVDRRARLRAIPKCFVKKTVSKGNNFTDALLVVGDAKFLAKYPNSLRMIFALNPVMEFGKPPAAIKYHILNRETLPVPLVGGSSGVHE